MASGSVESPTNPGYVEKGHWRVVVRSIGSAGAAIVVALKQALPFPEERIAALLYQAPSELLRGLDRQTADDICAILREAGLIVDVLDESTPFSPGNACFDVALVVKDVSRIQEVVREVAVFLGLSPTDARRLLFASPSELVGRVSANTVDALRRRFEPLGVELDVSSPEDALFDLFLGACPSDQRLRVLGVLAGAGIKPVGESATPHAGPLVCGGLGKPDAERLWRSLAPIQAPVRIVNRDFQRFDVLLDQAPDSDAMIAYLVDTAGMPERIARKVVHRTPLVIQGNIPYAQAESHLSAIAALGGRASAHLLAFQTFALQIDKVGDAEATVGLIEVLGQLTTEQARSVVRSTHVLPRTATPLQARWLQRELDRVGTRMRMVLA